MGSCRYKYINDVAKKVVMDEVDLNRMRIREAGGEEKL
jgi:hypothetical protein